jgi:hypothetical protein
LDFVFIIDVSQGAQRLVELVEHVVDSERVLKVLAEVSNLAFLTSSSQVIVDPSNQDFFGGKLHEVSDLFIIFEETVDFGAVLESDLLDSNETSDLPADTEEHVRLLLEEN